MEKKKYFIYAGCTGFPYGLAEIQKIILISKSLVMKGNEVTVLCKTGIHDIKDHPELRSTGVFQKIDYVYTSGSPFRDNSFVKRNLLKIKGILNEFRFIVRKKKKKEVDFMILSTQNFFEVFYYFLLSKILRFKTVLNYVEYGSGIPKKKLELGKRCNDFLFDKLAPKITDSILPISEFLIQHIESVSPGKKYLKIPGLTDFDRYAGISRSPTDRYFLFCGAAGYKEIIYFIIDSFIKLDCNSNLVNLYLVINGADGDKEEVLNYIRKSTKREQIKMFSKLSEKQLFTYYKNAIALLIPLRPTFQDIARFPHKTGEYMASGNPVISTNYGEIKYYFTDMQNILLAEEYDSTLFAKKMKFVVENPELSKNIGKEGQNVAMKLFDYRYKATEIDRFFESQTERSEEVA